MRFSIQILVLLFVIIFNQGTNLN